MVRPFPGDGPPAGAGLAASVAAGVAVYVPAAPSMDVLAVQFGGRSQPLPLPDATRPLLDLVTAAATVTFACLVPAAAVGYTAVARTARRLWLTRQSARMPGAGGTAPGR